MRTGEALNLEKVALEEKLQIINIELETLRLIDLLENE